MKEIYDVKWIEYWINKEKIWEYFDTPDLVFHAYRYEKGEYIAQPGKPLKKLLFLVEGSVQIYGIHDDGSISPVNQLNSPVWIGDYEYTDQGISPFYAEAKTTVTCLALFVEEYRERLDRDIRFLHVLLKSYADKLKIFSSIDRAALTVEERVLLHMQKNCPAYELKGIETAMLQVRCSRRQLQRVLKKLCDNGEIEKIGKGRYRLSSVCRKERIH